MREPRYARLIMLGTAFDTRGGIAAAINVYRAQGLFERWPIEYVPTHCDGGAVRKLLTAVKALLRVIVLLARHRRVVMHVHSASRASFWRKSIFMAIGMAAKCPVIFQLHGGGFEHFYEAQCGKAGRRIIRSVLDRTTCIIVLSERWRAWITRVTENQRVVCIPNPVAATGQPPGSKRENLVLYLGRLERSKGIFDLLDTICGLRGRVPDLRLICAGEGNLQSAARYAKRLGIDDAVRFTGWIGPTEKQSLMRRAAVLVLPSYAEGLPMSLLEAMASGLPVVATAVGGIPDVVTDGLDGFLFTPGDTATLQRLLCRLMHEPKLGMRIAMAARETVRLRFAADRVAVQLDQIYAGIGLTGSAGARACMPRPLREAA